MQDLFAFFISKMHMFKGKDGFASRDRIRTPGNDGQVVVHEKNSIDPVPACQRRLEICPQRRELTKRIVKVICVRQKADEETEREWSVQYEIYPECNHDELRSRSRKAIDRIEKVIGYPRSG